MSSGTSIAVAWPPAPLSERIALEPAPADADSDALPAAWLNCAEQQQHPVDALEVIEPQQPGSWWPAGELGQLVGLTRSSICRRRRAGDFGREGTGWRKFGGTHFYAPEVVGRLETEKANNKKTLPPKQEGNELKHPRTGYGGAP
jgi:hypothetical protein